MTRQKNKTGDTEKWDQTESPEFPDRGETSEMPGLPSVGLQTETEVVRAKGIQVTAVQIQRSLYSSLIHVCIKYKKTFDASAKLFKKYTPVTSS